MPLPSHLQALVEEAVVAMRADPLHHLSPSHRMRLYQAFESPSQRPPVVNPFRGWLGIAAARYALPIWQQALPLWKEIPDGIPDDNLLPKHLLTLAEGVLRGTTDVQTAWQEVNDQWYVVGNLEEEFTAHRDDVPLGVYYACDAALKALYEALNTEFLGKIRNGERYTDDDLPDEARDAASSAMMAYASAGDVAPVDVGKRCAFWEWWLNEAMPAAWEQVAS